MAELIRCDQCKKEMDTATPRFHLERKGADVRAFNDMGWTFDLCSWACVAKLGASRAPQPPTPK